MIFNIAYKNQDDTLIFKDLIDIASQSFSGNKLMGFVYFHEGQYFSFGEDLSDLNISQLCQPYLDARRSEQYKEITSNNKRIKIFDLRLQESVFILFLFKSDKIFNAIAAEDIFSIVRFKKNCDTKFKNINWKHRVSEELCDLKITVFSEGIFPELLENYMIQDPLESIFVWHEDKEHLTLINTENLVISDKNFSLHELRKILGIPCHSFKYCNTILPLKFQGVKTTRYYVRQNLCGVTDKGCKIFSLTLKPAHNLSFLDALPFPSALIDRKFNISVLNKLWHTYIKRTAINLKSFLPQHEFLKLSQVFDGQVAKISAPLKFAPQEWFEWHIQPYEGKYLLTLVDQKYRLKEQKEQKHYLACLEEHNIMLKQFAHLCAHDLKEPLRTISSYVQLLSKKPEKSEQYSEIIHNSCHNLRRLIDGILEYSTCEMNENRKQAINLNEVINTALMYLTPEIENRKADIQWECNNPIFLSG